MNCRSLIKRFVALFVLIFVLVSYPMAGSTVKIPFNIGAGPAFNMYNGIIGEDQFIHTALKIDCYALIDKATLAKFKDKIPASYRKLASRLSEARLSKLWIPESIIISPKVNSTSIYGINFRPFSYSLKIINKKSFGFDLSSGINLTYFYLSSDKILDTDDGELSFNFLRPGIDLQSEFTVKFTKKIHITFGAESNLYIPQEVADDGTIMAMGNFDKYSVWNMNQFYAVFHYTIPFVKVI